MSNSKSILIRGGHVIDPANDIDGKADVLLRHGRVAEIGKIRDGADQTFDARGLIVTPGFIDLHVHLRQPGQEHKENIATGTAAAAAGGFTSVCAMPNTSPVNDSPEITAWMQSPDRGAVVNVFPIAAATRGSEGKQLTDYRALRRAGAVAVTDDGRPILDDAIMRNALTAAARLGIPVIQHAEDTGVTAGAHMNAGPVAFRLGLRGMPGSAEASVIVRDIELAKKTKAAVHIAHISAAASIDAVRRGKRHAVRVTAEVTPHHFTLIDEDIGDYDTLYKMNPPLRSREDRKAVVAALRDGIIDAIATDHAPHAHHEKEVEFDRALFGITGLETALPLAITVLHKQHDIPLRRIIELLTSNPARIINLADRGHLGEGAHADVTIFDPKQQWNFDVRQSRSRSRNTPFDGAEFTGKVIATIVASQFVYRAE